MHRVKGLDFDHVIIAGANSGTIPLKSSSNTAEKLIEDEQLLQERSLMFVAATRAKRNLFVTGYGAMSEFLGKL
jgi:superfamily I DNA/RNA helicase